MIADLGAGHVQRLGKYAELWPKLLIGSNVLRDAGVFISGPSDL
jgi:hypothetical protein